MKKLFNSIMLFIMNFLTRSLVHVKLEHIGNMGSLGYVVYIPEYFYTMNIGYRLLVNEKVQSNFELIDCKNRVVYYETHRNKWNMEDHFNDTPYPSCLYAKTNRRSKLVTIAEYADSSNTILRHKKYKGVFFCKGTLMYHPFYDKYIQDVVCEITKTIEAIAVEVISDKPASNVMMFYSTAEGLKSRSVPLDQNTYTWDDMQLNYIPAQRKAINSVIESIKNDKGSFNILFGQPGCGKTAALNYIIHQVTASFTAETEEEDKDKGNLLVLIIPPSIAETVGSEAFNSLLLDFEPSHNEPPNTIVVIIEDSKQLIEKTEPRSRYTSGLLGIIDGFEGTLFRNHIHILLTYNTDDTYRFNDETFRVSPDTGIDEAILREGRLKEVIYFMPLYEDKADRWCIKKGIEPLGVEQPISTLYGRLRKETSKSGK